MTGIINGRSATATALAALLAACATTPPPAPPTPATGHIEATQAASAAAATAPAIPDPVTASPLLPAPTPPPPQPRYTLVVNQVPLDELLFALARDADLNIDIAGPMEGSVTLNAVDQTLPQILDRIMLQAPLRYHLEDGYLRIEADTPFLQSYQVPYLNMARRSVSRVDLATQIGSTGFSEGVGNGPASGAGNNSSTRIDNVSDNLFWESLIRNLAGLLGRDSAPQGRPGEGDRDIIANREAGLLSVRATAAQHRVIGDYIREVVASARRQVLIEATVVEISLSDRYQAGIDWSVLSADGEGFDLSSNMLGQALNAAPFFALSYSDSGSRAGNVLATLRALQTFGDVQVLSSPKIIALNNQTAVLKVVDNRVYFTTSVTVTEETTNNPRRESFDTELHTVPIGLVMNVTPYVAENDEVILNVRPTISRILGFVNDPNPDLARAGVTSPIPEIQVREMESLLRVGSGQVAVIGGLMQDTVDETTSAVPGLSRLPLIGGAFRFRDERVVKTELLVFLRPTVIRVADLEADLSQLRRFLPTADAPAAAAGALP